MQADYSQDQLSVMEAMQAAGIGALDPLFYASYATIAELKHKFKLADKLLRDGLKRWAFSSFTTMLSA